MKNINILFVDDEKCTLHAIERLLLRERFNCYFAESGADAIDIMKKRTIHILVTDMRMPEMDGLQLLFWIQKHNPDAVRIVLSACTQTAQLLPCINEGKIYQFITKPLFKEELLKVLHDAIEHFLTRQDRIGLVHQLDKDKQSLRRNLSEKLTQVQRLQKISVCDQLTGLYNRRHMDHVLAKEFKRYKRYKTNISCLLLDLDHFKRVNDTFGHPFGDLVLREFASRVGSVIRESDIAFRYGGEEFFVLLPETGYPEMRHVGERIVAACAANPYESDQISEYITVSIGGVSAELYPFKDEEELIKKADENLYKAKAQGRNRACFQ
jgi:diguanylate cyclase (GGDEF)-like protein